MASQPSPLEEAQRAASDLQKFFQNLRAPDRWAASASAVLLVLLALPWQWTRKDEDIIGLVAAWPVGIFAAAVIALVYLRARGADSKLDRTLRSAQFGASAFAAIFCGLFLPWASESQTMRGAVKSFSVALSTPQPGAYLGLVCAAVAVGASFVTFRE